MREGWGGFLSKKAVLHSFAHSVRPLLNYRKHTFPVLRRRVPTPTSHVDNRQRAVGERLFFDDPELTMFFTFQQVHHPCRSTKESITFLLSTRNVDVNCSPPKNVAILRRQVVERERKSSRRVLIPSEPQSAPENGSGGGRFPSLRRATQGDAGLSGPLRPLGFRWSSPLSGCAVARWSGHMYGTVLT